MTLAAQLAHAWQGAQAEVLAQRGWSSRLRRAALLLKLVALELVATARLAPYALRALACHRCLLSSGRLSVNSYAPSTRCIIELVKPAVASASSGLLPIVVYVNGGVWSAGDSWSFAPLAKALSDAGLLVCIAQYRLFPSVLVPSMVDDVCAALDWVHQNALRNGGDPARVTLLGHSAGAHLSALALLRRPSSAPPLHAFIGLAGVYDVAQHYGFEKQRGVHSLSTMEAAMGGQDAFESLSPACIVRSSTAALLPPVLLLSSTNDRTVPPAQSHVMEEALLAAGAESVAHLQYSHASHLDFACSWELDEHLRRPADVPFFAHDAERALAAHAVDTLSVALHARDRSEVKNLLSAATLRRRGRRAATTVHTRSSARMMRI
jgi:acetyl esterase/lipase